MRNGGDARGWAVDRGCTIGKLDKALDEAKSKGGTVVDMRMDWKTVFSLSQPDASKEK